MKLDSWLVEKMIIEKDFDQLKKILQNPEKANKLIAYSKRTGNFTITEISNEGIIANYATGKFSYEISFLKKDRNKIEYQFKATNYYMLIWVIPVIIYKNDTLLGAISGIVVISGVMFLLFYLINFEVRKGIYNRINNRWKDIAN
jgi:hypothetical protein|tara:strand:- start:702 stop:1136 length:435 start_codon:yes stop_codon:yes gene_type:complete